MSEEKEDDKPKKLFVIEHVIWDDGEVDSSMFEFRKQNSGRGAPGKWRLGPKDFNRRVEELLGASDQVNEILSQNTGLIDISSASMKPVLLDDVEDEPSTPQHVVDEDENHAQEKPAKKEKKTKESKSSPKDDLDNIEFGEFDK